MELNERAAEMIHRLGRDLDNLVILDAVDSTHSLALRLIDQIDNEELTLRSTVVLATSQRLGFGRGRRQWISPPGGLYLNWISSTESDEIIPQMPMLAAASAHAAVTAVGVKNARIKWPNDILVENRKLAGLLIHARRGEIARVTVGLGVNIHPVNQVLDDPIHQPTSLEELRVMVSGDSTRIDLAVEFVSTLAASLVNREPAIQRWRDELIHEAGDSISVRLSSGEVESGTFAGLTDEGFLRLKQGSEERTITGGDVVES